MEYQIYVGLTLPYFEFLSLYLDIFWSKLKLFAQKMKIGINGNSKLMIHSKPDRNQSKLTCIKLYYDGARYDWGHQVSVQTDRKLRRQILSIKALAWLYDRSMYVGNCRVLLNVDWVAMFHIWVGTKFTPACWLRPFFSINRSIYEIFTHNSRQFRN